MHFRILGLHPQFSHLFGKTEEELRALGVQRLLTTEKNAFPDRIELRDAEIGESVLLLNYTHQPADNPYQSKHAIFVREGASTPYTAVNAVPEALRLRTLSLRAFDSNDMMVDADIVEGAQVETLINKLLANPQVRYIQVHHARRGCYAARVQRADAPIAW